MSAAEIYRRAIDALEDVKRFGAPGTNINAEYEGVIRWLKVQERAADQPGAT